MNKRGYLI